MAIGDLEIALDNINVAPTETQLGVIACHPDRQIVIAITNSDGSQTLNVNIQKGVKGSSPWALFNTDMFLSIGPGETRIESFDINGLPFIRIYGTASGAGLVAAIGWRKSL